MTFQMTGDMLKHKLITHFEYDCPVCWVHNDVGYVNDPRAYSNVCHNCYTHLLFIFRVNTQLEDESQDLEYRYWLEKMRRGEHINVKDVDKPVHRNFMWAN